MWKALVGAFFVIVKSDESFAALVAGCCSLWWGGSRLSPRSQGDDQSRTAAVMLSHYGHAALLSCHVTSLSCSTVMSCHNTHITGIIQWACHDNIKHTGVKLIWSCTTTTTAAADLEQGSEASNVQSKQIASSSGVPGHWPGDNNDSSVCQRNHPQYWGFMTWQSHYCVTSSHTVCC